MYKATVRWMIRHTIQSLNEGDYGPALGMFADDATLAFPGDNTWANQFRAYRSRAATHSSPTGAEPSSRRSCSATSRTGIQMEVEDILVNGPPWNTRAAARVHHWVTGRRWRRHLREPRGAVRHTRVGKDPRQEDYEDTTRVAAFDALAASQRIRLDDTPRRRLPPAPGSSTQAYARLQPG